MRDAVLLAARRRIRVRIEAERDSRFATQFVAYRLGHALSRRGYEVAVELVGGDSGEAQERCLRIRAV
jgi:hypothetical protein